MKIKNIITMFIILLAIETGVLVYLISDTNIKEADIIKINDLAETVSENFYHLSGMDHKTDLEYTILDAGGEILYTSGSGLTGTLNEAMIRHDTVINIIREEKAVGTIIVSNRFSEQLNGYKGRLFAVVFIVIAGTFLIFIIFMLYLYMKIFRPFRQLQAFAVHITDGNLDIPIPMKKENIFGAFTESFDLMREEMKRARENERLAEQSKKELVASISHDIKTPVASIKAIAELMSVKIKAPEDIRQLETINSKADQINSLVTNMFNATLEELSELKVNTSEQSSGILTKFIKNIDYKQSAEIFHIPECVILADPLRLEQIIDNIITNSYKYADTSIYISGRVNDNMLEVEFCDYGPGVEEEEIPLLFNKYYRAGNAKGKSGTGLGLFISKYLIQKMYGNIVCHNTERGFLVMICLQLV